ncbi:MAG: hypothetical protein ASARMPRED_001309 [Alectoria sarmentosa]|nr:MAG: hypothetical protein ASARMPRED_001309 [Alectoria sarmentosa]
MPNKKAGRQTSVGKQPSNVLADSSTAKPKDEFSPLTELAHTWNTLFREDRALSYPKLRAETGSSVLSSKTYQLELSLRKLKKAGKNTKILTENCSDLAQRAVKNFFSIIDQPDSEAAFNEYLRSSPIWNNPTAYRSCVHENGSPDLL